jgi:glycosyltransferase involved in cell wall biosynthesis
MKVLIIMPLADRKGGAELLLLHLLKAGRGNPLTEYGIAFLNDGPMVEEAHAVCPLVKVFRAGRIRHVHRWVETICGLAEWVREERFGIVMSWMSTGHLYGGPAAMLAGVPNVWWQHGFSDRSALERLIAWLPTAAIFCCSAAVEHIQAKASQRPARIVIHPGVDLKNFDPSVLPAPREQRIELNLPEAGFLVGIVGRLQKWKGMDVFVDAAAMIAQERSDVHFVIVGGTHALEPGYPAELTRRIAERGLSERIRLAGFQAEPAAWMNACDVVVHASISPEPLGMVILEAMALGKVVIASAAGGPLEIVIDKVNGYLSAPGDAAELAKTLRHALAVGVHDVDLSNNARSTAGRFSINHFAAAVAHQLGRFFHGA